MSVSKLIYLWFSLQHLHLFTIYWCSLVQHRHCRKLNAHSINVLLWKMAFVQSLPISIERSTAFVKCEISIV